MRKFTDLQCKAFTLRHQISYESHLVLAQLSVQIYASVASIVGLWHVLDGQPEIQQTLRPRWHGVTMWMNLDQQFLSAIKYTCQVSLTLINFSLIPSKSHCIFL